MRFAVLAVLLLVGCSRHDAAVGNTDTPGGRLEAAALARGLVPDPGSSILGAWARDTDRLCIVPGQPGGNERIGALVDYGEGQGCAASGTVVRTGGQLDIRFDACRMTAIFDGERIIFPPEVPGACDRSCVGRASFAALAVDRQSGSVSEAATLRTPSGRSLCAG
ncbi:hypothetical protein [Sphingomonas bacterium]|uniref:hypothetical protein n=1 Tax=Sphingomonas bacterium TaxID=1895847 RepID=UPI0020C684AB|nr:hypothetical protein [Sphingomonas bacterium]